MSRTAKNKVEDNCVKTRQTISKNFRNMLNGIELRVNEDKLQDRDEKIRKLFTAKVCPVQRESSVDIPQRYIPKSVRVKNLFRNDIHVGNSPV